MKGKRILTALIGLGLILLISACGANEKNGTPSASVTQEASGVVAENTEADAIESKEEETPEPVEEVGEEMSGTAETGTYAPEETGASTLVVYFSATGTTKGVAEKIAAITDADLFEIVPEEPYTAEDLNYNDRSTRATVEQNTPDARPAFMEWEMAMEDVYDTIFIGYPIWWGEEPRIMDTFVERYSFGNATMVPFCTSGGSGVGRSDKNLEEKAGSGNWLSGTRLSGSITEEELRDWIDGLQ